MREARGEEGDRKGGGLKENGESRKRQREGEMGGKERDGKEARVVCGVGERRVIGEGGL